MSSPVDQADAWATAAPWPVAALYGALIVSGLLLNLYLLWRYAFLKIHWVGGVHRLMRRPWRMGDLVWVVVVILVLHVIAFGLVNTIQLTGWLEPDDVTFAALVLQSLAMHGAAFFCILYRGARQGYHWRTAFSCRGARWLADSVRGLGAYLATLPVLLFYVILYQAWLYWSGYESQPQDVLQWFIEQDQGQWRVAYLVVLAVILAPIAEELMFRGLMLPILSRAIGLGGAIAVSSALFAMLHMHIPSLAPLFVFSIALSLAYVHTRSIVTPIVMHAAFNAVSLLAMTLMSAS